MNPIFLLSFERAHLSPRDSGKQAGGAPVEESVAPSFDYVRLGFWVCYFATLALVGMWLSGVFS